MTTAKDAWWCSVPEGEDGNAKVERFEISGSQAATWNIRCEPGHEVDEGRYTRLLIDGETMMSDTPKEYDDHVELFQQVHGRVLVHGLGLGCALNVLLNLDRVESVTVIEINPSVIKLVAPHFEGYVRAGRLQIIEGDAFSWKPEGMYDMVWSDIWIDLNIDNLEQMDLLRETHKKICGQHLCWSEVEVRERQKEEEEELEMQLAFLRSIKPMMETK